MRRSILLVLSVVFTTSGCDLISDVKPPDCAYGTKPMPGDNGEASPGAYYSEWLRDPYSGRCVEFSYPDDPYPYPPPPDCNWDDPCSPCLYPAEPGTTDTNTVDAGMAPSPTDPGGASDEAAAQPSWGVCDGFCETLAENQCLTAEGCRAAYMDSCPADRDCQFDADAVFIGCWVTDMAGPLDTQPCAGLDAWACSTRQDCSPVHGNVCPAGTTDPIACYGSFATCIAEPAAPPVCYQDYECGDGYFCDLGPDCQANGDADPEAGVPFACSGVCTKKPTDGVGNCYDEVSCDLTAPDCPSGTLPGIADGCFTGYCIPLDACEKQAACADISAEATCVARGDCAALYEGVNCTCVGDDCTCTDWSFAVCTAQ